MGARLMARRRSLKPLYPLKRLSGFESQAPSHIKEVNMKTDNEIIDLFSSLCSFEDMNGINPILKNIILPLNNHLENFSIGNDKIVLLFKDYPYVIKFTYRNNSNKSFYKFSKDFIFIREKSFMQFLQISNSCLKQLFLPIEKLNFIAYPLYKQRKIEVIKTRFDKPYVPNSKTQWLKEFCINNNLDGYFVMKILQTPYLVLWLYDLKTAYDENTLFSLLLLLNSLPGYDLQSENLGYLNEKPVLIDSIFG